MILILKSDLMGYILNYVSLFFIDIFQCYLTYLYKS